MSGSIRKVLGPCRARAVALIQKSMPTFDPAIEQSIDDKLKQISQVKIQLKHDLDKLSNAVAFLISKDEQWLSLIQTLEGEEKTAEEKLYSQHIDREDGHFAIIVSGQDCMSVIKSSIDELDNLAEKLQKEQLAANAGAGQGQPAVQQQTLKLPKIELPTFSGDPTSWKGFWDLFQSSVHNQPIANVQKLAYLNSKLTGAAAAAVAGLAVTDANYTVAINLLTERFGQDSIVKNALFAKLRNLRLTTTTTKDLRSTLDTIERILRQLESLNQDVEQAVLVDMIRCKLPSETLLEMQKLKQPGQDWTVAQIRTTLSHVIVAQEEVQRVVQEQPKTVSKSSASPTHSKFQSQRGVTTGSLASAVSEKGLSKTMSSKNGKNKQNSDANNQRWDPTCIFCHGSHYSSNCQKYTTVAARKAQISNCKDSLHCMKCLRQGHIATQCRNSVRCYYCKSDRHHSAFCYKQFANSTKPNKTVVNTEQIQQQCPTSQDGSATQASGVNNQPVNSSPAMETMSNNDGKLVRSSMLLTAFTKLKNSADPTFIENAQIFFDIGAQRSFITNKMVEKLQLPSDVDEELLIFTFGTEKAQWQKSKHVLFEVLLRDGTTISMEANSVPHLTNSQARIALSAEDQDFIKKSLPVSFFGDEVPFEKLLFKPDVIIGQDYFWEFILDAPKTKLPSGLFIIPSKLGLLLGGKQFVDSTNNSDTGGFSMQIMAMTNQSVPAINQFYCSDSVSSNSITGPNLEDFWQLESIGITDPPNDNEDDKAIEQFNETVEFNNGRYFVKWPAKHNIKELPDNKTLALKRFRFLLKRFQREPELLQKYAQVINDQLEKGIIEPVCEDVQDGRQFHYLPHHPVVQPQRTTTKVRIVYDGSARTKNTPSINNCLLRGPVILPDLCGLLIRFRQSPIGIIADVEKAFLQIGLQDADRDLARFWWLKDPTKPGTDNNLQIFRFCRVPFGIISSPFLLAATIKHHLAKINAEFAKLISNNIYVDNIIVGVQSVEKAISLYQEGKQTFQTFSMNLRAWVSNSKTFNDQLPNCDRVETETVKVLGLEWNTKTDQISIKPPPPNFNHVPVTKRSILKAVASIFDPLGLITPVSLPGKILLQDIWKLSLDWDDPLPPEMTKQWEKILSSLQELKQFSVNRFIDFQENNLTELHVFVDASEKAYAAVIYLRQLVNNESFTVKLLFSKVRLAPKKPTITVPRLELLALLIGCRALLFLNNQLHISVTQFFVWSDSECCLQWISSNKSLARFVSNRVKEILSIKQQLGQVSFNFVSSKDNPADKATRGMTVSQLLNAENWWNGPKWLQTNEWPETSLPPITSEILEKIESEQTKHSQPIFIATANTTSDVNNFWRLTSNDLLHLKSC